MHPSPCRSRFRVWPSRPLSLVVGDAGLGEDLSVLEQNDVQFDPSRVVFEVVDVAELDHEAPIGRAAPHIGPDRRLGVDEEVVPVPVDRAVGPSCGRDRRVRSRAVGGRRTDELDEPVDAEVCSMRLGSPSTRLRSRTSRRRRRSATDPHHYLRRTRSPDGSSTPTTNRSPVRRSRSRRRRSHRPR